MKKIVGNVIYHPNIWRSMFNPTLLSKSYLNILFVLSVTLRTRLTISCCSQFVLNSTKIHHVEFVALIFIHKILTFYHKVSPRALQWVSKMRKYIRKIRMDQLHVGTEIPKLGNFPLFTRHSIEYTSLKFCSRRWTNRPPVLIKLQNLFIISKCKWKSLSRV